jgi:hypothetical protein
MSDTDELVLPTEEFARMPYETRDDKEVAKRVVAANGRMLKYVSARLANDTEVVRLAVSQWTGAFAFAGDAVHADKRFVTSLLESNLPVYCHLRERLSRDLHILKRAVRHAFTTLNMAPEDLKANKNVVRRLVLVDSRCFEFAASSLREDQGFVLSLMKEPRTNKATLYRCASPALQTQLSFVRQAVCFDENIYLDLDEFQLRNDRDVIFAAVAQRGSLILKAPSSFLDDSELVMLAIHARFPFALRWASYRIRNDPDIALAAIRIWPKLFDAASEFLQMSKTFVWDSACCGHFPHRNWHGDRALLLESVVARPSNLRLLSPTLRYCPVFLREAMHREPSVFFHAISLHRADPALAREALALEPKLFCRLAARLRRDPEFRMLGARTSVRASSALDAVDAEIDTLLAKAQRLADGAASLAHRIPDVTEQAETIAARVHQPHGLVFREVHKRGFEEAFGDA